MYLGKGSVGSAYGAAGSLVIILVWIYYSAQIMFFGAEFTQVYTNKYGSHVRPAENAVPVTEEMRAQQGMPRREDGKESTKAGRKEERGKREEQRAPGRPLKTSPWFK